MNEELNEDGLPVGVPLTFEQIRQAEFNRASRMATPDSDSFRIFTQQAQRKQRRKREEAEGGEA